MKEADVLATNLCKSGYGFKKDSILRILNKLSQEDIRKLTYNMYRTAEKCGAEAFDYWPASSSDSTEQPSE